MARTTDNKKHYVNNPEFLKEMKVHIDAVKTAKKDDTLSLLKSLYKNTTTQF